MKMMRRVKRRKAKEKKRKTGLDTATIRYRAKKQIMGYKFLSESTT